MWKKTVGLLSILAMGVGLAGCQERYEWRQKMTVIVDTPYGERSGSSVTEVVAHYGQLPLSASEVSYELHGEAVVVEISPNHFLFALLGEDLKLLAARVWKDALPALTRDWLPKINSINSIRDVPKNYYPLLVTFDNNDNPLSIQRVQPDNLDQQFGRGTSLKSIRLEITREPVTAGRVQYILKWLQSIGSNHLDGRRYEAIDAPNRLANSISLGNFSIEIGR
jgi:hypothetical protein